jgi:diaminopimelate epimerase
MTFERGLWYVTKACGTGSTASLKYSRDNGFLPLGQKYTVHVLGGDLQFVIGQQDHFLFGGPVKIVHLEHQYLVEPYSRVID